MSRKSTIKKGVMRFPNFECVFLAAIFKFFPHIRRRLGITTGEMLWEFISTASRRETDQNGNTDQEFVFNVGRGEFDQHGKPANQNGCHVCSLDLVRESYDFLEHRPKWLTEIFELVRANDTKGTRISRHPNNLRELMTAMSYINRDDPQLVLDWSSLAFCGVFTACQKGVRTSKAFDPQTIIKGVEIFAPDKAKDFQSDLTRAIGVAKAHWEIAQEAVKKSEQDQSNIRTVLVPSIGKVFRIIYVESNSFKTGAAGRKAGYQIVVQRNRKGHVQVHGGFVKDKDSEVKSFAHLGEVAKELRLLEAQQMGYQIDPQRDLTVTDFVVLYDETVIPWYLAEFLSSTYNGTMSSSDVPVTLLNRQMIMEAISTGLPRCLQIIQIGDGDKEVVPLTA